jgi:hypothetical protein
MPHAEKKGANGTTNKQLTNGEKPNSQFIHRLTSYPVVSDTISTYKTNPYGAKSLNIAHTAYSTIYVNFYKPISPYLRGPYAYVAPYLAKADSVGDSGLSSLESRFPIVKSDTAAIKDKVTGVVGIPLQLAGQGKDYVLKAYDEEYKRTEGNGYPIVRQAKAVFSTELKLTSEALSYVVSFLQHKKAEGKKFVGKKTNKG